MYNIVYFEQSILGIDRVYGFVKFISVSVDVKVWSVYLSLKNIVSVTYFFYE